MAGVPEVDVTHVGGTAQTAGDLKASLNTIDDFLDTEIAGITAAVITNAAGADIAADIIAMKADTAAILVDTGTTLDGRIPAALVGGKMDSVADMTAISGDTTAADNLEKEYDGTGYGHILQRTTIATLASQTSFTLTAGSADNDAYNGCIIVIEDVSTAAQKAVGVVGDYTGATKTVTMLNDPAVFTMATTDIVTIIADRALKATVDNRTLDVSATGEGGVDWANVGSPTTAQNLSATNIDVDQVVASVSGAVGSVTGLTAATVHSDLDDIQARLPAVLVGGRMDSSVGAMAANVMTAAASNADFLAEINAEVADVLKTDTTTEPSQGAPTATPTMQEILTYLYVAVRNRLDVDSVSGFKEFHNDAGTVIFKKAMTDAGGIYSEAEAVIGP